MSQDIEGFKLGSVEEYKNLTGDDTRAVDDAVRVGVVD
jgi:hypothetical protein